MLSVLDELGDGFCCTEGEGFFRVNSATDIYPVVDTTPGVLWSFYALRRMFYVGNPDNPNPPDFITVVVTLGMGADPGKCLLIAVENVKYEALMLYDIQPFYTMSDSRVWTETAVKSLTFKVPVFGMEFNRQRYNVIIYDDNDEGAFKASFEVYLGEPYKNNLILAQSGDYGYNNYVSRSFVLFEEEGENNPDLSPKSSGNVGIIEEKRIFGVMCFIIFSSVVSLGIFS
jgi:hypothetical protein